MKVTINRTDLIAAVSTASRAISPRMALPALLCVLLQGEVGTLKATCTDLDRYLTTEAKSQTETEGSCAVSAQRLRATLEKMESLDVNLSHASGKLTITGGSRVMHLFTLDVNEFPKVSEAQGKFVKLPAGALGSVLGAVAPFASDDPTRYVICGVHLHWREDRNSMAAVATTGKILGLLLAEGMPRLPDVTIPNLVVKTIVALDVEGEAETMVSVGESAIYARGQGWTLTAKKLEGDYPSYRQTIPTDGKINVTFERSEMLGALALTGLCVCDKSPSVKLTVSEDEILLSGNSPEQSEGTASIARLGNKRDRKPVETAYAPQHLREALHFVGGEECTISVLDGSSPCAIRNGEATAVLMPYRIA